MQYEARKLWKSIIESLPPNWFITADLVMFELFCSTVAKYHEYGKRIAEEGACYEDSKGIIRATPWVAMQERAMASIITMSGKLKINPKSRDGDTLGVSRKKAAQQDLVKRTGRKPGLMYSIPGGKRDEAEKPSV